MYGGLYGIASLYLAQTGVILKQIAPVCMMRAVYLEISACIMAIA